MLSYITKETGITFEHNQQDLRDIFKALYILRDMAKRNRKSYCEYPAKSKSYGNFHKAVEVLRHLASSMTSVDPYAGPSIGYRRKIYKSSMEKPCILRYYGSLAGWDRYDSVSYWYQSILKRLKDPNAELQRKTEWFYDKESKELRSYVDYIFFDGKSYSKKEYFQLKDDYGNYLRPIHKDKCIPMGGSNERPFTIPDGVEFISDPQDLEDITKGKEFSIKLYGFYPGREFNLFPFTYKGKHIRFDSLEGGIIFIDFKNLKHLDFRPTVEWIDAIRTIGYGSYYERVRSGNETIAYISFNYKKRNEMITWLKNAFGRTRANVYMPLSSKRMTLFFDVVKKMFKVLDNAEVIL